MNLRARMKPGCRPVILGGAYLVPEFPTYWVVPQTESAAVERLVRSGQVEYEPAQARGADGTFAVPGLEPVRRNPGGRPPKRRPESS